MPGYLLNQPDDVQLATLLKELLRKPEVSRFDALVAFAVSSGVQQLQPELEALLARGGHVRIVVGVSNRVTTVEGLELLLESVKKGARVFVFHNDNASNPIFHPKLYLCQGANKAFLIVGSNNMTGRGLVGNYEISLIEELDLKHKPDAELLTAAESIVETYCDVASGLSHALDEGFLQTLQTEGYLGSEKAGTNRPETSGESDVTAAAPRKKLFASKGVPQRLRVHNVNDFGRENHPEPPAWFQHRYRGENKGNPSIRMLGKRQVEKFKDRLRFALRFLWQVLIANEWGIPHHTVKIFSPL